MDREGCKKVSPVVALIGVAAHSLKKALAQPRVHCVCAQLHRGVHADVLACERTAAASLHASDVCANVRTCWPL
eukprot:3260629-Pleurochrysis_carterae.AAC.1